jgi:hypothetical protein
LRAAKGWRGRLFDSGPSGRHRYRREPCGKPTPTLSPRAKELYRTTTLGERRIQEEIFKSARSIHCSERII